MKKSFEYKVTDTGNGIYLVNEGFSTMFVICGEERALVLDCGTGVGDFAAVIRGITSLPYDVALTHAHVDHAGGRGQFERLFVGEKDVTEVKKISVILRKGYAVIAKSGLNATLKGTRFSPVKKEPKLIPLKEGDTFPLGGRTITVYETPGHTLGSLSYLDDKTRTIFIGDVANEELLMFLPHATTIEEMLATHAKLLDLDYDTVWSSHHNLPCTKAEIKTCRDGALQVFNKYTKNSVLRFFAVNTYKGFRLLYRPTNVRIKHKNP